MDRRKFINDLSFTVALACTGCLAACSKGDGPSEPNNPNPPGGNNPVTVNLATEILNPGDAVKRSGVIIIRLNAGNNPDNFAALSALCTHEQGNLEYNKASGKLQCPVHDSEFSTTGAVLRGPATTALRKFTIAINGTTLSVS